MAAACFLTPVTLPARDVFVPVPTPGCILLRARDPLALGGSGLGEERRSVFSLLRARDPLALGGIDLGEERRSVFSLLKGRDSLAFGGSDLVEVRSSVFSLLKGRDSLAFGGSDLVEVRSSVFSLLKSSDVLGVFIFFIADKDARVLRLSNSFLTAEAIAVLLAGVLFPETFCHCKK
ncbi:unnamed protein product [Pylaiella littoralis]